MFLYDLFMFTKPLQELGSMFISYLHVCSDCMFQCNRHDMNIYKLTGMLLLYTLLL